MVKAIFDTNFWSYLASSERSKEFEELERSSRFKVLLPPSILLEALRANDPNVRVSILRAMCKGNRTKMRTEADLEVEELVREVRRLRPRFINIFPNTKKIQSLRVYWKQELWETAIQDHESLHKFVSQKTSDLDMLDQQKKQKETLQDWDVNKTLPSQVSAELPTEDKRFEGLIQSGRKYEPWRFDSLFWYKHELVVSKKSGYIEDGTIVDWAEPWIKITDFLRDEKSFYDFWLHDVEISRMPRNYTRWAMSLLQPFRKIGEGNPFDNQHSTYLLDADLFFTCDRRYYECLRTIHKDGISAIARPILLTADLELAFIQIRDAIDSIKFVNPYRQPIKSPESFRPRPNF